VNRISWQEYFMNIAKVVGTRSTCLRRQVGAVIVKDKRILTTGYNGIPSGLEHCTPISCFRMANDIPSGEKLDLCDGIHAEQNAIIHAAKHGINIDGSELYITLFPCFTCAKMIINSGIRKIYVLEDFNNPASKNILEKAGIKWEIING
jgi:dCMP deaminase